MGDFIGFGRGCLKVVMQQRARGWMTGSLANLAVKGNGVSTGSGAGEVGSDGQSFTRGEEKKLRFDRKEMRIGPWNVEEAVCTATWRHSGLSAFLVFKCSYYIY